MEDAKDDGKLSIAARLGNNSLVKEKKLVGVTISEKVDLVIYTSPGHKFHLKMSMLINRRSIPIDLMLKFKT